MKNVKAIGFDLFNTLVTIDSTALAEAETRLTGSLLANGIALEVESFIDSHKKWAGRLIEATRANGRETHNRFWIGEALGESGYEIDPDDPRIAAAVEAYFSSFVERCSLIPGTIEMLMELSADYRIGLLSNFTHGPAAREILDVTGLGRCFPVTVISGEFGFRKPHRLVFERLLEEMGVPHEETIYVGDDPEPDITGALGAGIRPVWTTYVRDRNLLYAPGYMPRGREKADYGVPRISSWGELLELLKDHTTEG
jgi:putative hydrolase of the HAD superfamily